MNHGDVELGLQYGSDCLAEEEGNNGGSSSCVLLLARLKRGRGLRVIII